MAKEKNLEAQKLLIFVVIGVGLLFGIIFWFQRQEIPDTEQQIGYIKNFYDEDNKHYLDVDYIQWFTGEEAKKAAFENGECKKLADCAPQGFYIFNNKNKIKKLEVRPNVEITVQTNNDKTSTKKINYSEFENILRKTVSTSLLKEGPYRFELKGDQVIKIDEQPLAQNSTTLEKESEEKSQEKSTSEK